MTYITTNTYRIRVEKDFDGTTKVAHIDFSTGFTEDKTVDNRQFYNPNTTWVEYNDDNFEVFARSDNDINELYHAIREYFNSDELNQMVHDFSDDDVMLEYQDKHRCTNIQDGLGYNYDFKITLLHIDYAFQDEVNFIFEVDNETRSRAKATVIVLDKTGKPIQNGIVRVRYGVEIIFERRFEEEDCVFEMDLSSFDSERFYLDDSKVYSFNLTYINPVSYDTREFVIRKTNTSLVLEDSNDVQGEGYATVKLIDENNEVLVDTALTLTLDNSNEEHESEIFNMVTDSDGLATFGLGSYYSSDSPFGLKFEYDGDDVFMPSELECEFDIHKMPVDFDFILTNDVSTTASADLTLTRTDTNVPVDFGAVTVYDDNEEEVCIGEVDGGGLTTLNLTSLLPGDHTLKLVFNYENYGPIEYVLNPIHIYEMEVHIEVLDVEEKYHITIKLTDSEGNALGNTTFEVVSSDDNVTTVTTDEEGIAEVTFSKRELNNDVTKNIEMSEAYKVESPDVNEMLNNYLENEG